MNNQNYGTIETLEHLAIIHVHNMNREIPKVSIPVLWNISYF